MTDRLEALFNRFSVRASLFRAGSVCGVNTFSPQNGSAQLHLIKSGKAEIVHPNNQKITVTEPSLLLYPRPMQRKITCDDEKGIELVCANLHFDGGANNPIASALPPFLCLPLHSLQGAESMLAQLFEEAFGQRCGRQALINRLFEIVLVLVLRHAMESGKIDSGMLAGMSHPKLRKALVAMHEKPADNWTLASLAAAAGMSRSVFAEEFRSSMGCTAGNYLQSWRIQLAQHALRKGGSIKLIAIEVGYGSEAAFSRAFKTSTGLTPHVWRANEVQQ